MLARVASVRQQARELMQRVNCRQQQQQQQQSRQQHKKCSHR
jgi:hypothetical protein